jgi:hypothetical protein
LAVRNLLLAEVLREPSLTASDSFSEQPVMLSSFSFL